MKNSKLFDNRLSSIKGRIIFGLSIMGLITISLVIYSNLRLNSLLEEKSLLLDKHVPAQNAGNLFTSGINESVFLLISYLETGNESHLKQWELAYDQQINPAKILLTEETELINTSDSKRLNNQLQSNFSSFHGESSWAISEIKIQLKEKGFYSSNNSSSKFEETRISISNEEDNIDADELVKSRAKINRTIHEKIIPISLALNHDSKLLLNQINDLANKKSDQITTEIERLRVLNTSAASLSVLMGLLLSFFIIRFILVNFKYIKDTLAVLNQGNIPEKIKETKNEINGVVKEVNTLIDGLKNVKNFALKVGQGEFDHNITVFDNQGELGESLAEMRESLSRVAKEDRQRNWINEGISKFAEILRTNNDEIQKLCDELISNLVKYTNSNQGAILLIEEDADEGVALEMKACYALNKKKFLKKRLYKGEGLVGQAWQENDIINITEVPETYINITSGLGHSSPRNVLIVPLIYNEETVGVLELASFNKFESYQVEFIKKVSDSMAASISSTRVNERTASLLSESQQLTEMMRAQEEEMRQNMEELEATQEEMERAQIEIRQKEYNLNALINNTEDTIFALDTEYRITVVNNTLRDKYKSMGIELKEGSNIFDVLPKAQWEVWKERYDRSLRGERFIRVEEKSGSNGTAFVETHHNPIKDDHGSIIGVSVIARDITQLKKAERAVIRKESILHAIINSTDDTFFAIDTEYNITVINETLKERFRTNGVELNEGDNIFSKLPKDTHEFWKEKYNRALNGETFKFSQERLVKDKKIYLDVYVASIKNNEGNVIGASVTSKDVTEWKKAVDSMAERELEIGKLKQALGIGEKPGTESSKEKISKS
jgi:PAS domain S-box-containing protein